MHGQDQREFEGQAGCASHTACLMWPLSQSEKEWILAVRLYIDCCRLESFNIVWLRHCTAGIRTSPLHLLLWSIHMKVKLQCLSLIIGLDLFMSAHGDRPDERSYFRPGGCFYFKHADMFSSGTSFGDTMQDVYTVVIERTIALTKGDSRGCPHPSGQSVHKDPADMTRLVFWAAAAQMGFLCAVSLLVGCIVII